MSVENTYYAVNWDHAKTLPVDYAFEEEIYASEDAGEDWLRQFPFGSHIHPAFFASWDIVMVFSEWLQSTSDSFRPDIINPIKELFLSFGLFYEGSDGPTPIRKELPQPEDWLVLAIPPTDVKRLFAIASSIDDTVTKSEFDRVLIETPCPILPNGAAMATWISSLREGLADVSASPGEGIIMGALA